MQSLRQAMSIVWIPLETVSESLRRMAQILGRRVVLPMTVLPVCELRGVVRQSSQSGGLIVLYPIQETIEDR